MSEQDMLIAGAVLGGVLFVLPLLRQQAAAAAAVPPATKAAVATAAGAKGPPVSTPPQTYVAQGHIDPSVVQDHRTAGNGVAVAGRFAAGAHIAAHSGAQQPGVAGTQSTAASYLHGGPPPGTDTGFNYKKLPGEIAGFAKAVGSGPVGIVQVQAGQIATLATRDHKAKPFGS